MPHDYFPEFFGKPSEGRDKLCLIKSHSHSIYSNLLGKFHQEAKVPRHYDVVLISENSIHNISSTIIRIQWYRHYSEKRKKVKISVNSFKCLVSVFTSFQKSSLSESFFELKILTLLFLRLCQYLFWF